MNERWNVREVGSDKTLDQYPINNGVYFLSEPSTQSALENLYLQVRTKEGRIYPDELVARLPLIDKDDPYFSEWEVRLIAAMRLHKYLLNKKEPLKILDIGCGNGWMANLMTQVYHSSVFGIDINQVELRQATRIFGDNPQLKFGFCHILKNDLPEREFDVIILSATIQYFPNLSRLLQHLLDYLSPKGEIHIIDSPIYAPEEVKIAQKNSKLYYTALGFPEMAQYYHHHTTNDLTGLHYQYLYSPGGVLNKVRRKILPSSDSPFSWIVIQKRPGL